ncbi:hypothetical protein [Marinobacter oulmenensis]|uniref:ElaB/YqjD/DUF883 family membrane-anchored ribosome-binding protein n=1 Tax=Marinobacter oulmenensis TaxID=643747 RepID=A0A840ULT1_9GAMM|nr:hypothetical protein [Marinobacter oulmenensis]MBB5321648.1 ElaB/YqjD/DUF883 family membrane-anchored ribosome-binding protein [Marinobacter oulmenensis]
MNKLTLSALIMVLTLGLAACSSEDESTDFEDAAENTEDMVDDAGNAVEESYEEATGQDEGVMGEMEEGVENAGEEMGEAADEAGDAMEESYDEATN